MYSKVSIIGCGTWGIAVAKHLHQKTSITLHHYRKDFIVSLEKNRTYRGSFNYILPSNIKLNSDIDSKSDLYIISTPVQYIRTTLAKKTFLKKSPILILSKGIEKNTLMFPSDIVRDTLGINSSNIAVMSGPNHAEQVVKQDPTSTVIASKNIELAKNLQKLFSDTTLRSYCSDDLIGIQLGGAVKNVISIASGIAWGLGYRENTLSAILTRGLHEIKQLGAKLGAKKNTLNGLAGLGDLVATSFSSDSRNRHIGIELAKGKKINKITESLDMYAEGVETSKSLYLLRKKLGVRLPICESVYEIIYLNKNPLDSINSLMSRELKNEF